MAGRVREDTKGKAMHSVDETVRVAEQHGHRMANVRVSDSGHVHVYECSDPGCRASFVYETFARIVSTQRGVAQPCPWLGC